MIDKLPRRDPSAAYIRKAITARRVGLGSRCECGEKRPAALIRGKNPPVCAACDCEQRGKTTMENHHFAGKSNSPLTVPVQVNDHRAELSEAQRDWPKKTLENKDRSPLLAAAASIRGFVDTILYLIKQGLLWIADMLEKADAYLGQRLGPKWWVGTEIEKLAPKT